MVKFIKRLTYKALQWVFPDPSPKTDPNEYDSYDSQFDEGLSKDIHSDTSAQSEFRAGEIDR